ncbi:MAG: PAS domain-containing sensor histidine kinase, partial [Candidatus Halalkalibacterium sp. M3_1C_030]
ELDFFKACFPDKEIREEVVEFMENPGLGWKEFPLKTKSGEVLDTSWTNIRLTDETSVGIGIDMTETKASQARLRESEQLLKNVFESLEESVILVDPQSRTIKDCNEATEKVFGYDKDELLGKSTRILHLDEEHHKKFDELGEEALSKEGIFQTEFRMKKKSGEVFNSEHTVKLVHNNEDEVERVVSVVRDITEQKKYEKELKRNKKRLLRSQEIGKIGDWEFDLKKKELTWSPMVYKIYELDPDSPLPSFEQIKDMYVGDDYERHGQVVRQGIEEGEPFDLDLEIETGKGHRKYVRAKGIPEKNKKGDVQKLVGTVQDITGRKVAEIERKKLSDIVQKSQNEIYVFNAETLQFEFVNKGALDNIGYSLEKMLQMTPMDIKPEFDREAFRQNLKPILEGKKEKIKFETYQKRADGSTYEVEVHAQMIETAGEPLMVAIVLDISDRKNMEDVLRKNERRLKNITNNIPGVVFQYRLNQDGTDGLQYVSEGAEKIWGMSPKEAKNNNEVIWSRIHNSDIESVKKSIQKSAENLSKWDEEWQYIKPDGSQHWQHGIGIPRRDDDGSIIWDSVIFDITERKRLREQVVQSIIEGEDRERKRIAGELHDGIAQYLTAANMNLEAIKKDIYQLSEKRKNQFSKGLGLVKESINEIRNISQNLMPKAIEDYGLVKAIEALVENYENTTDIKYSFNSNLDEKLLNEQEKVNIYRIVQEAVHNAVKHAECTKVSIQLYKEDDMICLTVEDNGVGISFYEDGNGESRNGNGLGLQSIRSRTRAMSASIVFDSVPDKGTVISLWIPLSKNKTKV